MSAPLEQIETLFHSALALPASDRRRYLETACQGDLSVLREVESLLTHVSPGTSALEGIARPAASDLLHSDGTERHLLPGSMLGPYRLDRKLGEGGMGSVYLATDSRLARHVAVKVISRTIAHTSEARIRFQREARAAAALSHPNIAAIYDVGETSEIPWLVMEYVDGVSLLSRLTEALSETAWMHYSTQIASALEHAHTRGFIHRDIKPLNILVAKDGHVKVIDFGLARAIQEQAATTAITAPDAFIGTLAYSAPEVLVGASASARSDIYSLGVVLYQMACGEQPFAGLTGRELISAVLIGSYPECRIHNSRITEQMAQIIAGCLSREPAARYKDGAAVLAALRNTGQPEIQLKVHQTLPSIAVLDFKNIGGPSDLDWLGIGIAETISADLAKLKALRVVSRSRVAQILTRLGGLNDPISLEIDLGRELDARWVVSGGYQQIDDRIRVTASLTDTTTGEAVVTGKLDGRRADLFDLQDRVVSALLDTLTIRLDVCDQNRILRPETRKLAAYEHYIRGRQRTYQMQDTSLSTAIHHFGQAITLDPDYALAYSALGTAHALRFIASSNPEDIKAASIFLERATELDPELGEPYPWLANIRLRRNDPEGAFAAGRKGVELQPDLAEAHYFYAGTYYMLPEFEPGGARVAPAHYSEAIRLQPRFHAAWLLMGAVSAFLGSHNEAILLLKKAVSMEAQTDLVFRFVGARTLLAIAQTRGGLWEAARAQHLDALENLRCTDHVYTSSFEALSACGLGDIELRWGNATAAQAHYRHARRIIRESRRMLGGERLSIRADAGLAAAYAATGEMTRSTELVAQAVAELERLSCQSATATFECSVSQLWLILAAAIARLPDLQTAARFMTRAQQTGWLDLQWLKTDPELQPLHHHPAYLSFVEELAAAPATSIPMPNFNDSSHSKPYSTSATS